MKQRSLEKEKVSSSQKGVPVRLVRVNFLIPEDVLEKLRDLAYWERVSVTKLVLAASKKLLSSVKEIKPRPKEKESGLLEFL